MKSEIHLSIIWNNALDHSSHILSEIQKKFVIIEVYDIHWSDELFIDNLKRFYSHSLSHVSQWRLQRAMNGKMKHCGKGVFRLIIFRDTSPIAGYRDTSSGSRIVNTNVFDLKQMLRSLTGGGHMIHGSDNVKETSKDLTLLLGKNYNHYLNSIVRDWNGEKVVLKQDVFGVKGFGSIDDLFYLLNASLDYVVLRNFEEFPSNVLLDEHSDVDILVENKGQFLYSTGARKTFRHRDRVQYTIKIKGLDIPFDVRSVGDNYFDKSWQKSVLDTRILRKDTFYSPNDVNYYYSLLYHALLHKPNLMEDYIKRLTVMADGLGVPPLSFKDLTHYMDDNEYIYVVPNDYSVFFKYKQDFPVPKIAQSRKLRQFFVLIKAYFIARIKGILNYD